MTDHQARFFVAQVFRGRQAIGLFRHAGGFLRLYFLNAPVLAAGEFAFAHGPRYGQNPTQRRQRLVRRFPFRGLHLVGHADAQ